MWPQLFIGSYDTIFCSFELFFCSFELFFAHLNYFSAYLSVWTIGHLNYFLLIWTIFFARLNYFFARLNYSFAHLNYFFLVIWTIFFMYYIILWVGCHAGAKLEGARPHPSLIKTKIKIKKKQLCKIPGSCYITWKIIISLFRGHGRGVVVLLPPPTPGKYILKRKLHLKSNTWQKQRFD